MENNIKVTFLGGASSIGASSILLEIGGRNFLIDCGIRFEKDRPLPDLSILEGKNLEAILVTHAHTDHTGGLSIVSEGFPQTFLYMTPPTFDLVRMLQKDALKIMDINLKEEGEIPIYSEKQVNKMLERVQPVHFYESLTFNDIIITYLPASHILGAAMIHFKTPFGNLLLTGDYYIGRQRTLPSVDKVKLSVDMVITESTYGNRFHSDRKMAESKMINTIRSTIENEGKVLIPAFAIGRAQEVLLILKEAFHQKKIPLVPVYVDGMVRGACSIYGCYERYVTRSMARDCREGNPFYTKNIRPIGTPAERGKILNNGPCIIVSSSGMLSGGASSFYAEKLVHHEKNSILITGYQDEESPGRALLNLAKKKEEKRINLNGKNLEVKCSFGSYSLSAHADRAQMVSFIDSMRPKTVVLVHGDLEAKEGLKQAIGKGDVVLAEDGMTFDRVYKNKKKSFSDRTQIKNKSNDIISDQVKSLIQGKGPYRLSDLAERIYKDNISEEKLINLTFILEKTGKLRRDDFNSNIFHKIDKHEEVSLENGGMDLIQLKKENPRGILEEYCAENKIKIERIYYEEKGKAKVYYRLIIEGQKVKTPLCYHPSHRVATQLAAREAIQMLSKESSCSLKKEDLNKFKVIEASEEEFFKLQNFKGKVLTYCQRLKIPRPFFKQGLKGSHHIGKYEFKDGEKNYTTKWYESDKKKLIVQASAQELLIFLEESYFELLQDNKKNQILDEDPRVILNNRVLTGLIKSFNYSDIEMIGPSHQPLFRVKAFAVNGKDKKVEGSFIEAKTKKMAQKQAAILLLQELNNRDVS